MIAFPTLSASRWRALVLIAAFVTLVRILMQPLIPDSGSVGEPSVIVEAGLIIPVFAAYAFVVYLVISYSYVFIEAGLPWGRTLRGLAFALCFGSIWMAYLFEPVPMGEGAPLLELVAYPLADGVSVIILGLLLGRFVSSDKGDKKKVDPSGWGIVLLLPLVMLATRLFEYNVLGIYSSYEERTLDTVMWVAATALIIGIAYFVLRRGVPSTDPLGRSLAFGLVFYGFPALLVNFFVALALVIDWTDMALRLSLDIAAVITAIYAYEVLIGRKGKAHPRNDGGFS